MEKPVANAAGFKPNIAGFICQTCCDKCPDRVPRIKKGSIAPFHFLAYTCAAKVSDQQILEAFAAGADGVLICGCLVGECESHGDNITVLRDIHTRTTMLKEAAIKPERLRREWVCAPGGESILSVMANFSEHIQLLGPLQAPAP